MQRSWIRRPAFLLWITLKLNDEECLSLLFVYRDMLPSFFADLQPLINPKDTGREWAKGVIEHFYMEWSALPLTKAKDVSLLRSYANGAQSVSKIKKSLFRLTESNLINNPSSDGTARQSKRISKLDLTGIDWTPVGVLFNMLNSAKANVMKQPISPVCTAIDPTARSQKEEDMLYLKYEKFIREDLDKFAKQLKIKIQNKRDLKYGELMVDIESLDLDPQKDDELQIIQTLFYKLLMESAMETMLQYDEYAAKMNRIKNRLLDDHYVLGVSCYEKFISDITGLPESEYWNPNDVYTVYSDRPDFSDAPFIYGKKKMTLEDVIKQFGSEFKDQSQIAELFNDVSACNKWKLKWHDYVTSEQRLKRNLIEMDVVKIQWKVWRGKKIVRKRNNNDDGKWFTEVKDLDYKPETDREIKTEEKWKQVTFEAYYIPCAKKVFKIRELDATFNSYGDQSMSMFGFCIYKSAEKSAVEQAVVLVDNFQRAYFKAQHALLKSKPAGYNINIKHLRNAAENVKEEGYTWQSLLAMFMQENLLITDSGDYEDKETFNNPAIQEIKGTNMAEVIQYWNIMATIKAEIRELTGINEQRDATTPNPESLVGLQKLALEASVNATYYIDEAVRMTLEDGYRWAMCLIQYILKPENKGTKPYEALMAFAGRMKPAIIESAGKLHAHQLGIKIEDFPTEAQKQFTQAIIMQMYAGGKLDAADLFAINRNTNYKDAQALTIIRQRKKEVEARKAGELALKIDMAKNERQLQSREKVATTIAQGEVTEETIQAKSTLDVTKLKGQIDLLLQQLKAQSVNVQIDKRFQNKLQENTQKATLETAKELAE